MPRKPLKDYYEISYEEELESIHILIQLRINIERHHE
jgi:hypothetical protein